MKGQQDKSEATYGFSALQRAEIAEIVHPPRIRRPDDRRFSALQRAEIAEIQGTAPAPGH